MTGTLLAGWAAAKISRDNGRLSTLILTGIVSLATLANLVMQLGAEPIWYKIGTLVPTVPAIVLVGLWQSE